MSLPKPPFRSVSEELLYNIYLKLTSTVDETEILSEIRGEVPAEADTLEKIYNLIQGLSFLTLADIDTLAKINEIVGDADLASKVDIENLIDNAAPQVNTLQKLFEVLQNSKENKLSKGVADGYAPLDATGKIPTAHVDYSADKIAETATRVFVSPTEKGNIRAIAAQVEAETAADAVAANRDNTKSITARSFRGAFDAVWAWIKGQPQTISGVWLAPKPALGTTTDQITTMSSLQDEIGKYVDIGNQGGVVVIDWSTARVVKMTQNANITSFGHTGAVVGKMYVVEIVRGANYTFTYAAGQYRFPAGVAPALSDPGSPGNPNPTSDILVFMCLVAGRLDPVVTPNLQNN